MQPRRAVEAALDLPIERFDELPFGGIVVDNDGVVIEYNEYETHLSHLERARVLGLNFFHDVAPCTAVQAFEGRFREFLRSKLAVSESFDYRFRFSHGAVDVTITFLKLPFKGRTLIAVERLPTPAPRG
jgi:photoactive yellow protein